MLTQQREAVQYGALLQHCDDDVQASSNEAQVPADAAIAAVGAISDEITGRAIIEASPAFLMASRLLIPAKGEL